MKPTVMIVEDEASLVTMLRYNLEKEGYGKWKKLFEEKK